MKRTLQTRGNGWGKKTEEQKSQRHQGIWIMFLMQRTQEEGKQINDQKSIPSKGRVEGEQRTERTSKQRHNKEREGRK